MLSTVANFLITVPVASPIVQGLITVVEILALGFALYWLWELGLRLAGRFGEVPRKSGTARTEKVSAGIPEAV